MSTITTSANEQVPTSKRSSLVLNEPLIVSKTTDLAVIGAGLGRTGTSSLQAALNILGYGPCYHMREVFKDPAGIQKWTQVGLDKENADWDSIFYGYKSTTDHPGTLFYKQMMKRYPDAKVILTVRDEESWWKSYIETIAPTSTLWNVIYTVTFMRNYDFERMLFHCIFKPLCGGKGRAYDKDFMIAAFKAHNDDVKATVPSDKLLTFDVKSGWAPLCKFLDCPVPVETPFPHVWETAHFRKMIHERRQKALKRLALGVLFSGVVISFVWKRPKTT